MTHDELIEAVAKRLDHKLNYLVERDTLACDLTKAELLDLARAAIRVIAPAVLDEAAAECDKWADQYRQAHKNAQARKQRQEARDFESMAMSSAFRAHEIRAMKTRYEQ